LLGAKDPQIGDTFDFVMILRCPATEYLQLKPMMQGALYQSVSLGTKSTIEAADQ
jgi:hypothetical protein